MDGVVIKRAIRAKLKNMIREYCSDPTFDKEEKLENIENYILENYVPKKMIDEIIIIDEEYGILVCNVSKQNGKLAAEYNESLN